MRASSEKRRRRHTRITEEETQPKKEIYEIEYTEEDDGEERICINLSLFIFFYLDMLIDFGFLFFQSNSIKSMFNIRHFNKKIFFENWLFWLRDV